MCSSVQHNYLRIDELSLPERFMGRRLDELIYCMGWSYRLGQ